MTFNPVLSTMFSRIAEAIKRETMTQAERVREDRVREAVRRSSRSRSTPDKPLETPQKIEEPKFQEPRITFGRDSADIYTQQYNQEVLRYNQALKDYQSQFTRPTGFVPGEPLYMEIGDEGLKGDVLVKDEKDSSQLRRSGYEIDTEKFVEDIEKQKEEQKEARREARRMAKKKPEKRDLTLFGERPPGRETISDAPTYTMPSDGTTKRDGSPRTNLSVSQTAEFVAFRTLLPQYWGITTEEYKRDIYDRGSPMKKISDVGSAIVEDFKSLNWDDRYKPSQSGVSFTVGLFDALGKQDTADFYRDREESWMRITDSAGRTLFSGVSVVGQVAGEMLQDPVRDVGLFFVGGGAGKVLKLAKPVSVKYTAWVGKRSLPMRTALKGTSIGLKTSAVGVIGGSVAMDIAKADDSALRSAQIIKDFALLGAGFRTGYGKPIVPKTETPLNVQRFDASRSKGWGVYKDSFRTTPKIDLSSAPVKITQQKYGATRQFPKGFTQVNLDFNIKSLMAVKSGKSRMSKASIRRASKGLPSKGQKMEKFIEYRGEKGEIAIPRKGFTKGYVKILEIKKPTTAYESVFAKTPKDVSKITTRIGGLELKKFNIGRTPQVTQRKDPLFKIKPLQRGVKYESTSANIKTRPPGQSGFRSPKFKELSSYETYSGKGSLLQEQKTKQLTTINIKKLSKDKTITPRFKSFGETFKKQQMYSDKGLAPSLLKPTNPNIAPQTPTMAETVGKAQGRDKVVQKILDKAKAKAELRKVQTQETLTKPKTTTTGLKKQNLIDENKIKKDLFDASKKKKIDATPSDKKPSIIKKEIDKKETVKKTSKKDAPIKKKIQEINLVQSDKQNLIQGSKKQDLSASPFDILTKKKKKSLLIEGSQTTPSTSVDGRVEDAVSSALASSNLFNIKSATAQDQRLSIGSDVVQTQSITPIISSAVSNLSSMSYKQRDVQDTGALLDVTQTTTTRSRRVTSDGGTGDPKPITPRPPTPIDPVPIVPPPPVPIIKPPWIRVPKPPRPDDPFPPPPRLLSVPSFGVVPRSTLGFSVKVRRGGVFLPMGDFASEREAFSEGQRIVGETAGASFKVKDRRTGEVVDPWWNMISKRFRPAKSERGVVVERRRYRISSPGELREITYKGLMTQRRSKGRGGFNLF